MQCDLDVPPSEEGRCSNTAAALVSPQDTSVSPAPMIHPANGTQSSIISPSYPAGLREAHSPARCQQGHEQYQPFFQSFPGLIHQRRSQTSTAYTGFQQPAPGRPSTLQSSHHQKRRKVNADLNPAAHVPVQPSSRHGIPTNEDSARQSASNCGQQRESTKQGCSKHDLQGTSHNNNTGLGQRPYLSSAFPVSSTSTARQGDSLGQTCPSQDLGPSVPKSKLHISKHPLLSALLKGYPPDLKALSSTSSSLSKKTCANTEFTTHDSSHFPEKRHRRSQQEESLRASLSCEQSRAQNLDHPEGTHSVPSQQKVSCSSLSKQTSTYKAMVVQEARLPTNEEILELIAGRVAYFRSGFLDKGCSDDRSSGLQSDCNKPKSSGAFLPKPSVSREVSEQCTTAAGPALQEDGSEGSTTNARLSPGTPMSAVEKSKHVAFDLPVQKHWDVTTSTNGECEDNTVVSSSDEGFQSRRCDRYLLKGRTTLHYSVTALKELIASLQNVDTISEMDNLSELVLQQYWSGGGDNMDLFTSTEYAQIMLEAAALCTQNEEDSPAVVRSAVSPMTLEKPPSPTLSCRSAQEPTSLWLNADKYLDDRDRVSGVSYPTQKEEADLNSPMVKIQNVESVSTNHRVREDSLHVGSQAHLSTTLPENKVRQITPASGSEDEKTFSVTLLKDPLYEDISDTEDMSQMDTEHEEQSFSAAFKHSLYEDISDQDSPGTHRTEDMSSSEPIVRQRGQGGAQMKSTSDEEVTPKTEPVNRCSCPCFLETSAGFERVLCPKCDSDRMVGRQTNHPHCPSSAWKDEDETDDQLDDDWLVIPLEMADLEFEPADEDPAVVLLDDGDEVRHCSGPALCVQLRPAPNPVPASAFPQMEDFDTLESFKQAKAGRGKTFKIVLEMSTAEGEPQTPESSTDGFAEPEDGSETDDSSDYPNGPQNNKMTASSRCFKNLSEPSTDTDVSKDEDDDTTVQKCQSISRRKSSEKEDIIILDSDTEDDSDHNCSINTKRRKRSRSSYSEYSTASPLSRSERRSPVDSPSQSSTPPSVPQQQSKSHRAGIRDSCLDHTAPLDTRGESRETLSNDSSVIVLDTYTDSDWTQNYNEPKGISLSSSKSVGSGLVPCVQHKREAVTVDRKHQTVQEALQEPGRGPGDSSKPKQRSDLKHPQFKGGPLDDLSHSTNSGPLPEAKGGSEHVQLKTNRELKTSKTTVVHESDGGEQKHLTLKKKKRRIIISSETEDRDDASDDALKNLCSSRRPQKTRRSSEDTQKPYVESVADGSSAIPHFLVQTSQSSEHLKLVKECRVQRPGEDKTPTTSKKAAQHSHLDKQGNGVSKPKPATDTGHATAPSTSKHRSSSPRPQSRPSKLQRSHSNSCPSTATEGPSSPTARQPSTKKRLTDAWKEDFYPTRRDRKSSLDEDSRTKSNTDTPREAKTGPREAGTRTRTSQAGTGTGTSQHKKKRRRRHVSQEPDTPLMKKSKTVAMQLSRARNQETSSKRTFPVGEGYKW
ncbi:serine-rich adhesin for platelets-like isoform X1 [Embiotoca jacksoni]|uniref:serine-rich adhesin for platelets-like isoform X1 n=1 Tax=Embiotoca jacksoni TaxID=100190 RepID=UPI0037039D0C